jgi:ABC transport system ATP-binding/permease protein
MGLINLSDITVAFGGPRILDGVSVQIESGERVALLGRNGAGKTTLMKVMTGELEPSIGEITFQKGLRVAHLSQEVARDMAGDVFDVVASGLGPRAELLSEYHHVSHRLHTDHSPELLRRLDRVQSELDRTNSWELDYEVELVISKMKLSPDADFISLSGGQKRRVLLARALVLKPDVLLLDEPTNHLDIESIIWLESFLKDYPGTVFFVTHDRQFMEHVATRILDLDRGRLYSWACDYKTYLERKQLEIANEAVSRENFDKRLAEEEVWVRQGVKARRCRNEGRVKALLEMRSLRQARRDAEGLVRMKAQEADPSGHLVIKASRIGHSYDSKCLIRDLSINIMRGDKIAVMGPNGSGKTTLLRILLGKLTPDKGSIRLGTDLEIAYYDQLREALDEEKTVAENVAGAADTVVINGKPRHVIGYLQDFLFTPERARTPVKVLSGGERNRLLLARLFTKPSNVLVMDEPTNDLDIETLELLEALLVEYSGTLLLVSHDRSFLNNVVTSTLVLEGAGEVNEYPGGYDDWLEQTSRRGPSPTIAGKKPAALKQEKNKTAGAAGTVVKLTSSESRELEALPSKLEKLEAEQKGVCAMLANPEFYKKDPARIAQVKARSEAIGFELAEAYQRWEHLESKKKEGA